MIVWVESWLDKGSLIIWVRDEGDGIGRDNGFKIGWEVIWVEGDEVFVFEMVVDGNVVGVGLWVNEMYGWDMEGRIWEKVV